MNTKEHRIKTLRIKIDKDTDIVAQLCDYYGEFPPEICIAIHKGGLVWQDICLVRQDEDGDGVDCLVWSAPELEDYTHRFRIPQYKEEDEDVLQ